MDGGELNKRIRDDYLVNRAFKQGRMLGLTDKEILEKLVIVLLDIKDTLYQKELDKLICSTRPLIIMEQTSEKTSKEA